MTSSLVLVRHGESVGNVAATRAEQEGVPVVPITTRDADTPLSTTGEEQARALGDHLAALPPDLTPDALWCSPYVRARRTAALATAGLDLRPVVDERLRDRELGILDGLTSHGVAQRYPDEAARRDRLGKLYYRPPGGESWADVALRLRSLVDDLVRAEQGRVLVVCHDAVVWLLRYVCEGLTEAELMDEVARRSIRNASVTVLTREPGHTSPGGWRAESFDDVAHLRGDAEVTEHPGQGDE
ncbi:histidine phosphatase family protein [Cellulomonas triticagri]|uniref:phosphoglycerate mutase (2,3-diphosphoglycerate-dependent) n=1 Tax=Cellulomonas triticagri TaxID=2483352 RepID=A0A3M2IQ74_9CELL|nr:histidine phosphatase family protein [Cellulomonas triticagri]RMI02071.1 histidine phosphatase family protein [Cellulomonas triticagri]